MSRQPLIPADAGIQRANLDPGLRRDELGAAEISNCLSHLNRPELGI